MGGGGGMGGGGLSGGNGGGGGNMGGENGFNQMGGILGQIGSLTGVGAGRKGDGGYLTLRVIVIREEVDYLFGSDETLLQQLRQQVCSVGCNVVTATVSPLN